MKTEWEKEWIKKLKFWFSREGQELQLCLVEQGYEERLSCRLLVLFGSGLTVIQIIKKIKEEIKR